MDISITYNTNMTLFSDKFFESATFPREQKNVVGSRQTFPFLDADKNGILRK